VIVYLCGAHMSPLGALRGAAALAAKKAARPVRSAPIDRTVLICRAARKRGDPLISSASPSGEDRFSGNGAGSRGAALLGRTPNPGGTVSNLRVVWVRLTTADRGSDGIVRLHEVSAGGSNTIECSAGAVGPTLADGKRTLTGLQERLVRAQAEEYCRQRRGCCRSAAIPPCGRQNATARTPDRGTIVGP
jgi:hypothetical protein